MRPTNLNELQRLFPTREETAPGEHVENITRQARLLTLQGDLEGSKTLLEEARKALDDIPTSGEMSPALIQWNLESGRWLFLSKAPTKAAPFFLRAIEGARGDASIPLAIEASLLMSLSQPLKNRTVWLKQAMEFAEKSSTEQGRLWQPFLHFMTGWTFMESQQVAEALAHFDQALAAMSTASPELRTSLRWSRARALRLLKRVAEALEAQMSLQAELAGTGHVNGYVELEIGEALQALEKNEMAREHFQTAHRILSQDVYYADNYPTELSRILKLSKNH